MVAVETKGTIVADETKGTIVAIETEGTVVAVETKGTIVAVETKGPIVAVETKGTIVAVETKGLIVAVETKGPIVAVVCVAGVQQPPYWRYFHTKEFNSEYSRQIKGNFSLNSVKRSAGRGREGMEEEKTSTFPFL